MTWLWLWELLLVMVVVEGMAVVHQFAANPGLLEAVDEFIGLVLVHLYLQEYLSWIEPCRAVNLGIRVSYLSGGYSV